MLLTTFKQRGLELDLDLNPLTSPLQLAAAKQLLKDSRVSKGYKRLKNKALVIPGTRLAPMALSQGNRHCKYLFLTALAHSSET